MAKRKSYKTLYYLALTEHAHTMEKLDAVESRLKDINSALVSIGEQVLSGYKGQRNTEPIRMKSFPFVAVRAFIEGMHQLGFQREIPLGHTSYSWRERPIFRED